MALPYVLIVVTVVMGTFFYRLAEFEQRSGWLWGVTSVALVFLAHSILGWGYVGMFGSQALLYGAMFVANLIHDGRIE